MNHQAENRVVRTICQECRAACGMNVYVEGGRAVRVEAAPDSRGASRGFCARAEAGLERLYSPRRLLYPLKRIGEKGRGDWQRITWDEALGTIASRFSEAKEVYGAESVCLAKGAYCRSADYVSRLGNVFGTPNVTSIDNTCYVPSASGRLVTYGFDGMPDALGGPECLLLWGNSPNPPLREGGKLVVVNVLETPAAKRADIWLRPRPGSDLALALGMLNVIVNEQLYDKDFVNSWTVGFDELERHVQQYPPEKVAAITWVPAQQIVDAARLFGRSRPGCLWNGNASEDTYNSTQCARAFAIMQSICGSLDVPGGTCQTEGTILYEGTGQDILRHRLPVEQEVKKLGAEAGYFPPHELWDPIVWKPVEVRPHHVLTAILEERPYPVRLLGVFDSNPMLTWSDSRRVYEALKKVGFLFVADLIMTPTAALADIVLPAASYLETDAVLVAGSGTGGFHLEPQQKVVQIGECRSDLEIICALAEKLGLGEYFAPDLQTLLDDYLQPMGMTFDELRRHPGVVSSTVQYRKYRKKGFNTPSGKAELYSSLCEQWGYEALPVYHEPEETPFSAPELLKEYPLVLTNTHEANYVHSQDRYLDQVRRNKPEPLVSIHPDTAAALGVGEGDAVFIENKRGRIKQNATLDTGIDPRVVSVGYGWWFPERDESELFGWDEANLNVLTDDSPPHSPEMGSPKMRGFLCKVYKAE
ncbi:MAG: molybdopterin-dependent oxidoreductase [Thermoleophilia bacterium]|nr:molybdopterin-dependent oxidoreductase [Thermoleophilia bacterium]